MSEYAMFCNAFSLTMFAGIIASFVVCVIADKIESMMKRKKAAKARRKSSMDEFGWIELEPDFTGRGELRTKIHWSK